MAPPPLMQHCPAGSAVSESSGPAGSETPRPSAGTGACGRPPARYPTPSPPCKGTPISSSASHRLMASAARRVPLDAGHGASEPFLQQQQQQHPAAAAAACRTQQQPAAPSSAAAACSTHRPWVGGGSSSSSSLCTGAATAGQGRRDAACRAHGPVSEALCTSPT